MSKDVNTVNEVTKENDVIEALSSFGDYKSPGPDEIFPKMLSTVAKEIFYFVRRIFKRVYILGTFQWSEER